VVINDQATAWWVITEPFSYVWHFNN